MEIVKFVCINCKNVLVKEINGFRCKNCCEFYPIVNNIPVFIKNFKDFHQEDEQYKKNKKTKKHHIMI